MVTLDLNKNYSRYANALYCDDTPLIEFTHSKFCDWGPLSAAKSYLSKQGVMYMQKYIDAYPQYYKIMNNKYKGTIKKFFFDVETTGLNPRVNSIHQLAYCIEVDGKIIESGNLRIKPHPKAVIEEEALKIGGVTEEQIQAYPSMEDQFKVLTKILNEYVDPYSKGDKFFMIGFKSASFDDEFLKKYFDLMKSAFFYYFYASSIDVSCLAAQYLMNIRSSMPSFKLARVAKTVGIEVDDTKLHDAEYDVYLTREVYNVVSKIEVNIF